MSDQYDSPWKEALDVYFREFLALLFPDLERDIDWERGYEFLDTELQKVVRDANLGKRLADKLVKVWTIEGQQSLILVHVEIQGKYDAEFTQRMFVYNYRIFDRYRQRTISLAVLGDDNPQWRPNEYGYEGWGSQMQFRFPIVKLHDYRQNRQSLLDSSNPFAIVILAHLSAQDTRRNDRHRFQEKWGLVRRLYETGYTREQIVQLFRFIDWMLALPENLAQSFDRQLARYEEEKSMPYITGIERRGIERGRQDAVREDILEVLQLRFDNVPGDYSQRLAVIKDLDRLKQLHRQAITVESLEAFNEFLPPD
jgi:hypothetical protein